WLRTTINVPWRSPDDLLVLRLRYDEDAEVYVNGERLMVAPHWNDNYHVFVLGEEQKRLFREGRNTVAVFCRNVGGSQAIDAGLTLLRGGSDLVAAAASKGRGDDRMRPGSEWEGPRTFSDPVQPGVSVSARLAVLQRIGPLFRARLTFTGSDGRSHDTL